MKEIDESPESMTAYLSSELISVNLIIVTNSYLDASSIKPITLRTDYDKSILLKTSGSFCLKLN